MCGISGFVSTSLDADRAGPILRGMCAAIRHRGPDDEGYYADGHAALGIRRLSIIDVAGGHQPISNEDGTIWIVFNGEIYNFAELRDELRSRGHRFRTRSDTEVIVHLYEDAGLDCVTRLDGMFAFAIWDKARRRLFLARDRIGKKPLHYAALSDGIVFCSELKGLLKHPGITRDLSIPALTRYLIHDYVPAPRTIFRDIFKVPPGHRLVYEAGSVHASQYWDFPAPDRRADMPDEEGAERLQALLDAATRRRLVSEVPLGAFLSGGIDSSAVAALMARNSPSTVKTFCVGFPEKSFDETGYARRVASYLGTEHHEDVMTPRAILDLIGRIADLLDEPLADASVLPTYLLSRFTRERVTVALSGDGGDEMFAGYPTYQAHRVARLMTWAPHPVLGWTRGVAARLPVSYDNFSLDFKIKKFVSGLGHPPELRHAIWLGSFATQELPSLFARETWQQVCEDDPFSEVRAYARAAGNRDWLGRLLYLDAKLYLQDGVLVKVDRASMACSLEVRCPFLDTAVVEFTSRLPASKKLRGLTTKHLLKRSLRSLLPPEILNRPKKGFGVPLGFWIRGDLRALFQDMLSPARIARQGIFNESAVDRLLSEHIAGRQDHRKKLWNLFVFQMWYQTYLEGSLERARSAHAPIEVRY